MPLAGVCLRPLGHHSADPVTETSPRLQGDSGAGSPSRPCRRGCVAQRVARGSGAKSVQARSRRVQGCRSAGPGRIAGQVLGGRLDHRRRPTPPPATEATRRLRSLRTARPIRAAWLTQPGTTLHVDAPCIVRASVVHCRNRRMPVGKSSVRKGLRHVSPRTGNAARRRPAPHRSCPPPGTGPPPWRPPRRSRRCNRHRRPSRP
jgi:hypothetical protein